MKVSNVVMDSEQNIQLFSNFSNISLVGANRGVSEAILWEESRIPGESPAVHLVATKQPMCDIINRTRAAWVGGQNHTHLCSLAAVLETCIKIMADTKYVSVFEFDCDIMSSTISIFFSNPKITIIRRFIVFFSCRSMSDRQTYLHDNKRMPMT